MFSRLVRKGRQCDGGTVQGERIGQGRGLRSHNGRVDRECVGDSVGERELVRLEQVKGRRSEAMATAQSEGMVKVLVRASPSEVAEKRLERAAPSEPVGTPPSELEERGWGMARGGVGLGVELV